MSDLPPMHVTWTRTPPARCPRCHVTLKSVTGLSPFEEVRPKPGDITLCDQCHTWLAFEPDMSLRLATPFEIDRIAPEMRRLGQQAAAVTGSPNTKKKRRH